MTKSSEFLSVVGLSLGIVGGCVLFGYCLATGIDQLFHYQRWGSFATVYRIVRIDDPADGVLMYRAECAKAGKYVAGEDQNFYVHGAYKIRDQVNNTGGFYYQDAETARARAIGEPIAKQKAMKALNVFIELKCGDATLPKTTTILRAISKDGKVHIDIQ